MVIQLQSLGINFIDQKDASTASLLEINFVLIIEFLNILPFTDLTGQFCVDFKLQHCTSYCSAFFTYKPV